LRECDIDLLKAELARWKDIMRSYDELVEIARICMRNALQTANPVVSEELKMLARGYQVRAAAMKGGKLPDIGDGENRGTS
jgi:hypothetical protein